MKKHKIRALQAAALLLSAGITMTAGGALANPTPWDTTYGYTENRSGTTWYVYTRKPWRAITGTSGNHIQIGDAGHTVNLTKAVYGGLSGALNGCEVILYSGSSTNGILVGGLSEENISNSTVTLQSRARVTGTQTTIAGAWGASSAELSHNAASAEGSTICVHDLAGAKNDSGSVLYNTLTVKSSRITDTILTGGLTQNAGESSHNSVSLYDVTVTVSNTSKVYQAAGGSGASGNVTENSLTVDSSDVDIALYGGVNNGSGNISGNKVAVKDSKVTETVSHGTNVKNMVIAGGYSESGDATENLASVDHTVIKNSSQDHCAVGGYSRYGSASDNTFIMQNGSISSADLYGGGSISGDVSGNRLTVDHSTVINFLYGGGSELGKVSGNVVSTDHSRLKNTAYAGWSRSGDAESNTFIMQNSSSADRYVYGGYSEKGSTSGNVAILQSNSSAKGVYGGYSKGDGSSMHNKTYIESSALAGSAFGGTSRSSGEVAYNELVVSGEVTGSGPQAVTGVSLTGRVHNNTLTVKDGGIINSYAIAGNASDGDVYDNTITVESGGTASSYVIGGSVFDWDSAKTVRNNRAVVENGGTAGTVYGGFFANLPGNSTSGEVAENIAAAAGKVFNDVAGGYSRVANKADRNRAEVLSGAEIGGSVYGAGTYGGTATGNSAGINGGFVNGSVYGADTGDGTATDNSADISAGTVGGSVYGARGGTAANNTAVIHGGMISGDVYGANTSGDNTSSTASIIGTATGNSAYIHDGTVGGSVYGARAAAASDNTVVVSGGMVSGSVYGAETGSGDAESSTVTVQGGEVMGDVYGAHSLSGVTIGSVVNYTGGTIHGSIYGGACVNALNNTVNISFDTLGDVYGGCAVTGDASGNVINMYRNVGGNIYTGHSDSGTSSHNTLNVYAKELYAGTVYDTQTIAFYLPADIRAGDTMLHSRLVTPDGGTSANVYANGAIALNIGDSVYLLKGAIDTTAGGLTVGEENAIAHVQVGATTAYTVKYDQQTDNAASDYLRITVVGAGDDSGNPVDPQTELLPHTPLHSTSLINGGGDTLVDLAIPYVEEIDIKERKKYIPFAIAGGSTLQLESGSHIDSDTWNFDLGFARRYPEKGLLLAAFGEYGRGNYDTHLDDGKGASGNAHYAGGGIFARKREKNGLYYEGSLRAGRVSSNFNSNDMIIPGIGTVNEKFDYDANYIAAHAGIGWLKRMNDRDSLDTYLRWFYTHQAGFDARITTGELYNFDSVDSNRLRVGVRWNHATSPYSTVYLGAAWQYEFDGDAIAHYAGLDTLSPSLGGSSGRFELGWKTIPGPKSDMTINLWAAGWVGQIEGFSFGLNIRWDL